MTDQVTTPTVDEPRKSGPPEAPALAHHEPPLKRSTARRLFTIVGAVALALVLGFVVFRMLRAGREKTDDAQVAADVVQVAARSAGQVLAVHVTENQQVHKGDPIAEIDPQQARVALEQARGDLGTAKAQEVAARAQVQVAEAGARGGLVTAQAGVRGSEETVQAAGDQIAQARAAVAHAQAGAQNAALEFQRLSTLGSQGLVPQAQVDAARAARDTANADVAQARAALAGSQN